MNIEDILRRPEAASCRRLRPESRCAPFRATPQYLRAKTRNRRPDPPPSGPSSCLCRFARNMSCLQCLSHSSTAMSYRGRGGGGEGGGFRWQQVTRGRRDLRNCGIAEAACTACATHA